MSTTLKHYIESFLTDMVVEKQLAKNTLTNYEHYLKRMSEFLGEEKGLEVLTVQQVKAYRLHLHNFLDHTGAPLSQKTQNYHIIALRAFLKWLRKNDHEALAPEKVELGKEKEREVEYLDREELERLFNSVSMVWERKRAHIESKGAKGRQEALLLDLKLRSLRDRAILELLYSTGLRVSELTNLNREDLNLERREFRVRGKGSKVRLVFISERAKEHVETYLNERSDGFSPLFLNYARSTKNSDDVLDEKKRRLTTASVAHIVKTYAAHAGIVKHVTPHVLRHSFATQLLINGADIRSVQELLGHASVTTTQIYTNITHKHLKEVHDTYLN